MIQIFKLTGDILFLLNNLINLYSIGKMLEDGSKWANSLYSKEFAEVKYLKRS